MVTGMVTVWAPEGAVPVTVTVAGPGGVADEVVMVVASDRHSPEKADPRWRRWPWKTTRW
jgi:hypothetical protein